VDPPVVAGTRVTARALYPDPGKEALLALPRRVRTGHVTLEIRAPGRAPDRVRAVPDGAGSFAATVPAGATASVVDVRDRCGNTGR
jgi:hypothetical protein